MGHAQLQSSLYLWQHSQELNDLLGHVFKLAESKTKSFHIGLGAAKSVNYDSIKYTAIVACVTHDGKPHTLVTDVASTPVEMINQVEQFLNRL
jgi:hypothetical protein